MLEQFLAGLTGKQRWSIQDLAKDVATKVAGDAARLTNRLLNKSIDSVIDSQITKRLGARIATRLETTITEFGGTAEMRVQLAGGLAVNGGLTAVAFGQAHAALCTAQGALELARDTEGERAARLGREAAEQAFVAAFVELARLAAAE